MTEKARTGFLWRDFILKIATVHTRWTRWQKFLRMMLLWKCSQRICSSVLLHKSNIEQQPVTNLCDKHWFIRIFISNFSLISLMHLLSVTTFP